MLCLIPIVGGLLIMMGQYDRSEALFYYFRLEDQIPENHLLRLIEKHIGFAFVRQRLKDSYSETGRPSIDPELLLCILLVGYLYGITSERLGRVNGEFRVVITRATVFEPPAEQISNRLNECGIPFWPHGFVTAHCNIDNLLQNWTNEYACLGYGSDIFPALIDCCEVTGIKAILP